MKTFALLFVIALFIGFGSYLLNEGHWICAVVLAFLAMHVKLKGL